MLCFLLYRNVVENKDKLLFILLMCILKLFFMKIVLNILVWLIRLLIVILELEWLRKWLFDIVRCG